MNDIQKITQDEFSALLSSAEKNGEYRPLGRFLSHTGDMWTACDNTTGYACTEAFAEEEDAIGQHRIIASQTGTGGFQLSTTHGYP